MNELEFNLEMHIPKLNGEIYYAVYEIENWLRRICLTSFMIKYGQNWASKIPNKVRSGIFQRIEKNKDLLYLGAETDDNLIWMSMHGELRKLLLNVNIWPIVEQLTSYRKNRFTAKLIELNDIRNVLAHNRALSQNTNTIFQGLVASLQAGIENFKRTTLYTNSNILEGETDPVNDFFQQCMKGNDWGMFQAFLAKSDFFYEFVCLPVEPFGKCISAYKLLEAYRPALGIIIAFTVNKTRDEYRIIVPKNITGEDGKILSQIFTSNTDVWTEKAYLDQNPKFICNPKIWFYENRKPIME